MPRIWRGGGTAKWTPPTGWWPPPWNPTGTHACGSWSGPGRSAPRKGQPFEAGVSEEQVARVRALASDFGTAWNAPSTGHADRKRLLGHLIEDATLTREKYLARIELRMRVGKALALDPVELPRPQAHVRKTPAETVGALSALVPALSDAAAARELNRRGFRSWDGAAFSTRKVTHLRVYQGWPSHLEHRREQLRAKGWRTARELASERGMKPATSQSQARNGRRFERTAIHVDKATRARRTGHRLGGGQ